MSLRASVSTAFPMLFSSSILAMVLLQVKAVGGEACAGGPSSCSITGTVLVQQKRDVVKGTIDQELNLAKFEQQSTDVTTNKVSVAHEQSAEVHVVKSDSELTHTSIELLSEARKTQKLSQNPNATEEACDACITAEDALVANLTALSTAQAELTAAQTAHQVATSAHATCETELAAAGSATSTAKASAQAKHTSIGEHLSSDNAESAVVAASGTHSLRVLLTAWRDAETAQTTKDSECAQTLASEASNATAAQTKQTAVTDATSAKQTAEAAATSACATMRAKGYGAPTPTPTTPTPTTPTPTTPTPTTPTPTTQAPTAAPTTQAQAWTRYDKNCYDGSGAAHVLLDGATGSGDSARVTGLTLEACRSLCVSTSQCTAVTFTVSASPTSCFGRKDVISDQCHASGSYFTEVVQATPTKKASLASVETTDISPTDASFADKTSDASHDKATDASPNKP